MPMPACRPENYSTSSDNLTASSLRQYCFLLIYSAEPSKQQGSSAEWAVFHVMSKILEAAKGLCLPLPPALNPFEEQENVDAHFVEEIALKQTFILMGFEEK
ncbi:hypothetical protein EOD39_6228 [Acipenser ruthenus]|uniref:Gamma-secretase-activating protein C-terminal domain-containing protein n=1 Tax=Acipenser ruthenus TaxID=7906 RepID=A0A444UAX4_ACIRT|nr:hypothetical protein EOD39_6228 [Acipenser ruthenus]